MQIFVSNPDIHICIASRHAQCKDLQGQKNYYNSIIVYKYIINSKLRALMHVVLHFSCPLYIFLVPQLQDFVTPGGGCRV